MSQVTGNEEDENVIVATLVRGKTYVFHEPTSDGGAGTYHTFQRSVGVPVSEELAAKLEDLTEDVPDGDGDVITKDMFRIDRDAPAKAVAPVKKRRFRLVSEEVEERPIVKAPPRKALGAKKAGTFGSRR